MKLTSFIQLLIVIIIIIGGVIIIIIRVPMPDPPPCLVCGSNGLRFLGIVEVVLGAITLGAFNRFVNNSRVK